MCTLLSRLREKNIGRVNDPFVIISQLLLELCNVKTMGADDSPEFLKNNELASAKQGGKIIFATDDWFAVAENLLKDEEPEWKEGVYTDFGKWMDGWETRRKRKAGHDWAIIALKQSSIIKGFYVDTAYFTGNYAPKISIQAAKLDDNDTNLFPERYSEAGTAATEEELQQISRLKSEGWKIITPMTSLGAGYPETQKNYIKVNSNESWTHLRLNLFPDGGIARLRVYGIPDSKSQSLNKNREQIDLIADENGGSCEKYSNAHYGSPKNIIKSGNGLSMSDGWETARRLDRPSILKVDSNGILQSPGSEWAVFKLGQAGIIESVVIDTAHFKGNFPDNAKVEGINHSPDNTNNNQTDWRIILSTRKLSANKPHIYESGDLDWHGPVSHVRLTIAPDGGISRFRLFGYVSSSSSSSSSSSPNNTQFLKKKNNNFSVTVTDNSHNSHGI